MMRVFRLSLILWSLALMPSLCVGGVIGHPCSTSSAPSHPAGSEQDGSCDHETGCEADPCSVVVVRGDEFDAGQLTAVDLVPLTLVECPCDLESDNQISRPLRSDLRLHLYNLPFPQADIPLLI
mgnify:CR=1 FL=1